MAEINHGVRQDPVMAVSLMAGAVFTLATMDAALKQLVEFYPSMQVVVLRCALSAPLFAAWMLTRDRSLFRPRRWRPHLFRAAIGVLMLFAVGECLRELPLADAYAIFFAAPLLITLLSGVVMKEPAGPHRLSVACIGFIGVLIVLRPGVSGLISYGSLMALVAVAAYAAVALMLRSLGREEHSITIAFWFTALVGAVALVFALPGWQPLQAAHWPWLLLLGVTGTAGQLLLTAAFRRASAAVVAPLEYLAMFWAVLYGWWFWGDLPGVRTWVGSGVVVAAGLYIIYREHVLQRKALLAVQTRPSPGA
ncbi:MAG: DMT family transporter [Xanthomonadales bacterium]|nr:DMT family transporter [Xanthomonadales bacterium]